MAHTILEWFKQLSIYNYILICTLCCPHLIWNRLSDKSDPNFRRNALTNVFLICQKHIALNYIFIFKFLYFLTFYYLLLHLYSRLFQFKKLHKSTNYYWGNFSVIHGNCAKHKYSTDRRKPTIKNTFFTSRYRIWLPFRFYYQGSTRRRRSQKWIY